MAGDEAVGPEEGGAAELAAVVGPPHPLLRTVLLLTPQPVHSLQVGYTEKTTNRLECRRHLNLSSPLKQCCGSGSSRIQNFSWIQIRKYLFRIQKNEKADRQQQQNSRMFGL